jgi:SAM-dependent methyltransferase
MYSNCPVCGGGDLTPLWEVSGYTIAKCCKCTLIFVQNQLTPEDLKIHYSGGQDKVYEDESNMECLSYYYQKLANSIQKRFPKPGRVLDLGCSRGWFLDAMTGWECHGNEISHSDAQEAHKRYGDRIVTGQFEEYPMREGYFDVITLQDVFDHFRDPIPALEKCHRLLRPGGLIVIKVHNISCLYAKLTGSRFYAIIPPSHLFYYDRNTLAGTLARAGFHVVDSQFIGHLLKVQTVFWRLSRGDAKSAFFRMYKTVEGNAFGAMTFRKNLHDIITTFALKPVD